MIQQYCILFFVVSFPLLLMAQAYPQAAPTVDHHVHFFTSELTDDIRQQGYALTVPDSMITDINFILNINLVDKLVLVSGGYAYSQSLQKTEKKQRWEAVKAENDRLASFVEKYPDRLIGFYGLNPLESFSLKEMKRCHETLKLQGLKLHFHGSKISLRNPKHLKKVKKMIDYAAAEGIPILIHFKNDLSDFGPGDVRIFISEILDKIPPALFIFAHMGGDGGYTQETKAVLQTFADYFEKRTEKNAHQIFFELSGVVVYKDMDYPGKVPYSNLVTLIRQIGIDHVLFGSDYPVMPSSMYQKLLRQYLPLEEKEFEVIFHNSPF